MITLVALTFPDDSPSLDIALRALREVPGAEEFDAGFFPPPPFRRDLLPPSFPRDSRRFRFTDDPDDWRN